MRYLLFGVWLALLLAVGLAWMHERYSMASLPYTGQTKIHGFEQHLGAYRFSVWGYDADIFGIPNPDLIGPARLTPRLCCAFSWASVTQVNQ